MAADIPHKNPAAPTGHGDHAAEGQEKADPEPPKTSPKADVVPPYKNPYASKRKKQSILKWGKFAVEIVTLVVIGVYTSIAAYQARQMRKATRAAEKSAKVAHDALVLANRPWLGNDGDDTLIVNNVADGVLVGKFTFPVKNYGSSPALSVGETVYPFIRAHGDMSDFEAAKKEACMQATTVAFITGNSIFPQQTYHYGTEGAFVVPGLRKEIGRIAIEGCIAYTDQFDPAHTIHHTSFCVVGDAQSRNIQNRKILGLCGYHEIAD